MSTVTQITKSAKQPKGGYIPAASLTKTHFDDNITLKEDEAIHPPLMGLVVDYMTRFIMTRDVHAFDISFRGAQYRQYILKDNTFDEALKIAKNITGLNDLSIESAFKLVALDVWYRDPFGAGRGRQFYEITTNDADIYNAKVMIQRSIDFFAANGPVVKFGFELPPLGIATSGDGDVLTKSAIWDIKTLRTPITSKHTLQVLIYYLMYKHAHKWKSRHIKQLGFFNPRSNTSYSINLCDISDETIRLVEENILEI